VASGFTAASVISMARDIVRVGLVAGQGIFEAVWAGESFMEPTAPSLLSFSEILLAVPLIFFMDPSVSALASSQTVSSVCVFCVCWLLQTKLAGNLQDTESQLFSMAPNSWDSS
jgi:hypothetical protein